MLLSSNMVCCKLEKAVMFIYLWLWWSNSIFANDSLKPGEKLSFPQRLWSRYGNYCMYFGGREYNKDDNYLTISNYYGQPLWWSDGNQPVDPDSAVLSLTHSGVLKIESKRGKPIILYSPRNFRDTTNNTVATLLDTGNFELQQLHHNGTKSVVLWQSFDYPTNKLVPTMKLGVNHKSGHNWTLGSLLIDSLITPAAFSLEWEPNSHELIIKRRGKVCWRSGKLINNRFEHIPEEIQRMYQYTIVSNSDEDSFTFDIKTPDNVEFPVWSLLETGQLMSYEGDIARADMCYGYNNRGGCQRWEDIPTCREPSNVFENKVGNPNYENSTIEPNTGYFHSDCMAICWSNCNCTGFKSYYGNGTGCRFFQCPLKDYVFDSSGESFSMLENMPPHKGAKQWIWICVALAGAALLIICAFILYFVWKEKYGLKGKKRKTMETEVNESFGIEDLEDDLQERHDIKVFDYESVLTATNDFSPENKLGEGGFGSVYKGILPTGQEVAVKRLSKNSGQGIVEFKNELRLISELQHTNLVQLVGCCTHKEDKILIYEFMPNKSLDFFLFGEELCYILGNSQEKNFVFILKRQQENTYIETKFFSTASFSRCYRRLTTITYGFLT